MNIYVGNISWGLTEQDLENVFAEHGTVTSAKIITDRATGRSRGFGFVEMSDGAEAAKPDGSKSAEAAKPESNDTIFVHFIPPPLRAAGKKDLCWIVHTCNGTGCREVKHVTFHTVDSFSTFEGPPPDQSCGCNVANHHLRGRGAVIYNEVAQEAVIESTDPDAQINAGAYKADAKKLAAELARLKATIKHLRTAQHVKQLQGLHMISRGHVWSTVPKRIEKQGFHWLGKNSIPEDVMTR